MHGTETILVVDDEEALQELVQVSLQALGYRVLTASNGEQAMQILSDEHTDGKPATNKQGVDLLFSDVIMPGINGLELAERAHKQYPALKILLTSGYTEKAIAENRQSKFATNVLTKPYSQSDLTQRLRQMLDSHINNGS
jgi:CheY-like chemotaxis protein